jgi:hypothetical protein
MNIHISIHFIFFMICFGVSAQEINRNSGFESGLLPVGNHSVQPVLSITHPSRRGYRTTNTLLQPCATLLAVQGVGIVFGMATCGARAGIPLLGG